MTDSQTADTVSHDWQCYTADSVTRLTVLHMTDSVTHDWQCYTADRVLN